MICRLNHLDPELVCERVASEFNPAARLTKHADTHIEVEKVLW